MGPTWVLSAPDGPHEHCCQGNSVFVKPCQYFVLSVSFIPTTPELTGIAATSYVATGCHLPEHYRTLFRSVLWKPLKFSPYFAKISLTAASNSRITSPLMFSHVFRILMGRSDVIFWTSVNQGSISRGNLPDKWNMSQRARLEWPREFSRGELPQRNFVTSPLQWRHNGRDGVSNHQPHVCLLKRLFRCRSNKRSKLRVTGLCAGNSPATGEFPAQRASNAENVSIWWRHHVISTDTNIILHSVGQFVLNLGDGSASTMRTHHFFYTKRTADLPLWIHNFAKLQPTKTCFGISPSVVKYVHTISQA